jgi:hypothetical protein
MGWAEERESQSPTHLGGGEREVFMNAQAPSFRLKLQAQKLKLQAPKPI